MTPAPDIAIIGAGKVGTALGLLAARAGHAIAAVASRSPLSAARAAERIGHGATDCGLRHAAGAGHVVLLTVPDDAIGPLCRELAEAGAFSAGAVVAHCSGALGSDVLEAARQRCGCLVASCHPMQTFPDVDAAIRELPGSYCFLEGDDCAVEAMEALVRDVGCRPVRIPPQAKALHHAAAVTACNYMTAMLDAAAAIAVAAGIERATALAALAPLVRATIDNNLSMGPAEALTGPIARGDVQTVRRHVAALRGVDGRLLSLYAAAGLWTVDLARRKGTLAEEHAAAIEQLLTDAREGDDS